MDNYEKKYKEALERARQIKNGEGNWRYSDLIEITPALEEVFPELTESEDERILASIVDCVGLMGEDGNVFSNHDVTKACVLAWLEKQKEQKPRLIGEDSVEKKARQMYETGQTIEEQKPAEWSEDFGKEVESVHKRYPEVSFAKLTRIAYHFAKWADKYKSTEWSEEDETHLTNTLIMLKEYAIHHYSEDDVNKSVDWLENRLKSLRPQLKQEWDEEDKKMLKDCCAAVTSSDYYFSYEERCAMEDWLNSLRPSWKPSEEELVALKRAGGILRDYGHSELAKTVFMIEGKLANLSVINKSIWKPSEEQMEALKNVAFGAYQNGDGPTLRGLYEQLKKLM